MANPPASVPITVRGRYLWRGDERFFVRGVTYQVPDAQDPISDTCLPQLKHDVELFKELGLNTLFIYTVDNTKRHGQAMKLLEQAGIYVFTSVATPFSSINRTEPYQSYHRPSVTEYFQTVDVMSQYPNTLGLLAGNSVTNSPSTQRAAPVIKAVVRDLKRYMKIHNEANGQRILPIGYTAADADQLDTTVLNFLSWGDPASSIDFWTCNCYMWAGLSNYQISGYERLVARLQSAALPIIMSEYGVNIQPRQFEETAALYSPQMSQVFSGGCAYDFWESSNGYGLVELVNQEQPRTTPAWAVEQDDETPLARADDPEKTAEKRQTERGPLSIYHDFVNFKAKLDATRHIEHDWEGDIMEREATERGSVDVSQMNWPWEPENQIPDTVVDWVETEDLVNGRGLLYVM
ncbi:glycoside hydrolase family 72 protein [Didymella exigua CBS 183.55]|uniref:1,3-beta-glucanosyltransferase n=1 Tax=Didymella exigua CBS 183.55 TaxID=1150837 RepID=A0A6A5RZW5_9PLEO|nr:glycoside hydrolase family 72 protein [Didymella exigua CBS 183.55]KAF1933079.1 glycoside hydrolase family 72 protein [Didymella exigua CBS 183.55]